MSLLNKPVNGPVSIMFGIGLLVGFIFGDHIQSPNMFLPESMHGALPHQISKYPGGVSLRFAMVADVLHQRFPIHGTDYYMHRNEEVLKELAARNTTQPSSDSQANADWGLLDDLAVGYVHLGQYEKAIQIMHQKLEEQESQNISGRPLYSTYANLGTAMMIESLTQMLGHGDLEARQELKDSLGWVKQSIDVNPEAHFGREVWQVKLGEFLLRACDKPKILTESDMVGNNLASEFINYKSPNDKRSAAMRWYPRASLQVTQALVDPNLSDEKREQLREMIMPLASGVPFDEPTLAIIGMWRYGAGANAHFALALGEIMLDVGQRYIAWDAFERAARLADGFWPDEDIRGQFIVHCRERQADIESGLSENPQRLRSAFDAELKRGIDYQAAYQQYESDRLAHGARTDDPHFYDDFLAKHGHIASDPGLADEIFFAPERSFAGSASVPVAVLFGGSFAFITALLTRFHRNRMV